jgi:aspartyl-tRNA(Asn)/glutamyl-tRNA(Gln) amidotransferase subunit A
MVIDDIAFASLAELARGLRSRAYTSVHLVQLYLDRIARLDERAHAYVNVYRESALLAAQAADAQRDSGTPLPALHGLPIAVKDLCEIDQQITTAGSRHWQGRRSTVTSAVVERLQSAGMVLLGKTHMVEFAFGGWGTNVHMGTPRNPWDWLGKHRAPGGSSSGSGVAVAAGLAPAAIGSDTGGSVRIPAAFNGVTGLKTTNGRISLYGVVPMSPTLDTIGVLTRTAEDAALLAHALAGFDARDPRTHGPPCAPIDIASFDTPRPAKIAVLRPDQYPTAVTDDIQKATEEAIRAFQSLGATVEYPSVPLDFSELMRSSGTIISAEAYRVHAAYIEDTDAFDPWVRKRILAGRKVDASTYSSAQAHRQETMAAFDAWMRSYDVLLTPVLPFAAAPLDEIDEAIHLTPFTRPVNYLETCALSLPAGFTRDGMPIGVQLIGKRWQEAMLLQFGHAFQSVTDWHRRKPSDLH